MTTNDDMHKAVQRAVRDERTRVMSALLKLRNRIDGMAKMCAGNGETAAEAYEAAAGQVAAFITEQFGDVPDALGR